jgi:hypothetical protein
MNYQQLDVYKSSYKLLNEVFLHTKNLNKEYKYTLGEQIKQKCFNILIVIYKINRVKKRLDLIDEALDDIEFVRLSVRLLCDLKVLNNKKFAILNFYIEDVKIQFEKWYTYIDDLK